MQSSQENDRSATAVENDQRDQTPERDLAAELAQMEDRWKRALADLDNYRKRTLRDQEARLVDSREAIIRDWLEAVDSLDRALAMESQAGTPVAEGLRAVFEQMDAILARQGVTRIGERGEPFDPERHEAISVRATDEVPEGSVAEVARSGYAIGDRVIRPAQVVVAQGSRNEG
jgi:molecular chaperone GrpE